MRIDSQRKQSTSSAGKTEKAEGQAEVKASGEVERKEKATKAVAARSTDVFGGGTTGSKPAELPAEVKKALEELPPETVRPEDVQALQARLAKMEPQAREAEVKFLNEQVLSQPNAGRALSTYVELKGLQELKPGRLGDELVHTLTRGVAEARGAGAAGSEGVLGKQQALDAARAVMGMGEVDFQALQGTLEAAGKQGGKAVEGADPQAERALILKAVAARMDEVVSPSVEDKARLNVGQPTQALADVQGYASQVAGMPRKDLIEQSTVLDLDAGQGALQQRFTDSCVPTSQQMARAEADPVYARQLHQEAIHSLQHTGAIGQEQKEWLEKGGGVATPRDPSTPGGRGMWPEDILNDFLGPATNHAYTRKDVGDTPEARQAAVDSMEQSLRNGVDVPIGVYWNGGGGHAMLLTDVRGTGDSRQFLLTDPWHGQTAWVDAQSIVAGNTDYLAGQGRLGVIYL